MIYKGRSIHSNQHAVNIDCDLWIRSFFFPSSCSRIERLKNGAKNTLQCFRRLFVTFDKRQSSSIQWRFWRHTSHAGLYFVHNYYLPWKMRQIWFAGFFSQMKQDANQLRAGSCASVLELARSTNQRPGFQLTYVSKTLMLSKHLYMIRP